MTPAQFFDPQTHNVYENIYANEWAATHHGIKPIDTRFVRKATQLDFQQHLRRWGR